MKTVLTLTLVALLTGCATVADNASPILMAYDLARVLK